MRRPSILARWLLAVLCCTGAGAARADERPAWKFSGFGTLGVARASVDDARFRSNPVQTRGAGTTPDPNVDSKLGLQENLQLDDTFSAVGQVLTSEHGQNQQARIEWLFAQARLRPWLDVKAGRMVLPVFLVSESRNVGYAANWVRAPGEVYSLYPATSYDGAQLESRSQWGNTHLTVQASVGRTKAETSAFGARLDLRFDSLYSVNAIAENGSWTFRIGDTEADAEIGGLPAAFQPQRDAFRGIGAVYDNGKLLLQAESVIRRTGNGGLIDMNGRYLTAGYRLGHWTPIVTYSRYQPRGRLLAGLPATRTIAGGVRWDAFHNVALKMQVESTQNNGLDFVNAGRDPAAGPRSISVLTLLADFVF